MPGDHALLAPSSADRWLRCPPSARLTEHYPDKETDSMAEGTLAHSIAELKLRKYIEPMSTRAYNKRMKPFTVSPRYDVEMQAHTDAYLEYIKAAAMQYEKQPRILTERCFQLEQYVPESFGRCDCTILSPHDIHIIDFKYGRGKIVGAEQNPQMMLYALGAVLYYGAFYAFDRIRLTIFQPRVEDGVKEWGTSVAELMTWAESIRPVAEQAFKGEGEYLAGAWCDFCPAKNNCCVYAAEFIAMLAKPTSPYPLLSDEDVARYLTEAAPFMGWYEGLRAYALPAALDGRVFPGWKVVAGRSDRAFTDQDAAFNRLIERGVSYDALYERKPITLAGTEKLLGKADFAMHLSDLVTKPPGKPTLAPESDKRPPYDSKIKAEDVFRGKEET